MQWPDQQKKGAIKGKKPLQGELNKLQGIPIIKGLTFTFHYKYFRYFYKFEKN